MIAKKPKKKVVKKGKTLTLRLSPAATDILDEIMTKNRMATASKMIVWMIEDWMRLNDDLLAATDMTTFYQEQYDDLRADTEGLRTDLKHLLEKLSQPKLELTGQKLDTH